uniref:Cyclin IaZm n=1 Tax=Arundo donax TaxID=35708 RepID=A0A0A9BFJ0_ARUDO
MPPNLGLFFLATVRSLASDADLRHGERLPAARSMLGREEEAYKRGSGCKVVALLRVIHQRARRGTAGAVPQPRHSWGGDSIWRQGTSMRLLLRIRQTKMRDRNLRRLLHCVVALLLAYTWGFHALWAQDFGARCRLNC